MLLILAGAGVLRVSLFGDIALRYVKQGLQPYLVASGIALCALGAIGARRDGLPFPARRQEGGAEDREAAPVHGHDHTRGPRAAWLLLPPALLLLLNAPPALGSYTAARDSPQLVVEYESFAPLPASGPVPLSLTEFIARVQQEERQSLQGRTVVLQGFVTPGEDGTWRLARLLISCCAADAQSLAVTVHGVTAPPADTWVTVTGTWHPDGALGTTSAALALDAAAVDRIPEPPLPYVDRPPAAG
ncbi:TIGR03943 family protein [Streptomyces pacificus]|uniref:TIGR03943 family protein n=1 Tax=Streptomyces pacificus TaxID=2705029 RepID=A0A6A0APQ6_9ACTN|nr:TIGR03943 family protein [Streptomyces pacificus]